jgi:SAM-dependent methyltransferase
LGVVVVKRQATKKLFLIPPKPQKVKEEIRFKRTTSQQVAIPFPGKQVGESSRKRVKTSPDYVTLGSVWHGEDWELLEKILAFYPRKRPHRILDATINGGRFWRESKRTVIGLDIERKHKPAIVGDNTCMPFLDGAFDVVVYDPPHIPNQGKDRTKDFNTRFGLILRSSKEHGYTFTHTYPPFLQEAYRVLKEEGILLCKITDYVHDHRYQWAHVELIESAKKVAFCPCDCIIKVRKGPIIDPKWKVAHHSRRQHSYWLVFRKSRECE